MLFLLLKKGRMPRSERAALSHSSRVIPTRLDRTLPPSGDRVRVLSATAIRTRKEWFVCSFVSPRLHVMCSSPNLTLYTYMYSSLSIIGKKKLRAHHWFHFSSSCNNQITVLCFIPDQSPVCISTWYNLILPSIFLLVIDLPATEVINQRSPSC